MQPPEVATSLGPGVGSTSHHVSAGQLLFAEEQLQAGAGAENECPW